MHQACYYGASPKVVKTLVEVAGGNPLEKRPGNNPAALANVSLLYLAVTQGHWDIIDFILTLRPDILDLQWEFDDRFYPARTRFPTVYVLMMSMFQSPLFMCLTGGKRNNRCLHACPHASDANFAKTAQILVKHGLRYEDYTFVLDRHKEHVAHNM